MTNKGEGGEEEDSYALIISLPSRLRVKKHLTIMVRNNSIRGAGIEGHIMGVLEVSDHPLSPQMVAFELDSFKVDEIWEAMERLYFGSKLEKKNGRVPVYRVPNNDGKLSLPN
jgi:hypothetical protein